MIAVRACSEVNVRLNSCPSKTAATMINIVSAMVSMRGDVDTRYNYNTVLRMISGLLVN